MGHNPVRSRFKARLHHRTDGCGLPTEQLCKSLTLPMHRGTPYLRLCTFRTLSPSTKSILGMRIFGFPPARETCKLTTRHRASETHRKSRSATASKGATIHGRTPAADDRPFTPIFHRVNTAFG